MSRPPADLSAPPAESLTVWETADTVYVGWAGAGDDWLAGFAKTEGFPARAWAERMADLFNSGDGPPPDPAGPVVSHAPPR